jgi:hypothetical protein
LSTLNFKSFSSTHTISNIGLLSIVVSVDDELKSSSLKIAILTPYTIDPVVLKASVFIITLLTSNINSSENTNLIVCPFFQELTPSFINISRSSVSIVAPPGTDKVGSSSCLI